MLGPASLASQYSWIGQSSPRYLLETITKSAYNTAPIERFVLAHGLLSIQITFTHLLNKEAYHVSIRNKF